MGDRLATIYMGQKGGLLSPFWWGAAIPPGQRFTSVPSGIFIHPAVWPQQTWAENWRGTVPLLGEWGWIPIQHNVAWTEVYLISWATC